MTMIEKPAAFYVPVKLSPKQIKKGRRQYSAFLLNLIHWKWICWQADQRGFIHLKYEYITKYIPRNEWPSVKRELVELGVIHSDNRTAWDVKLPKCLGFKIDPKYWDTKRILCTNEALNHKIRRGQEHAVIIPIHKWFVKEFNSMSIKVEDSCEEISLMMPDESSKISVEEYRHRIREQCKRIANGDHYFSCDKYGRVHTPITNLPKQLRRHLRHNGQPLVCIDLCNSQPLMAGILAHHYHRNYKSAMRIRELKFQYGKHPYRRALSSIKSIEGRPDLDRYMEICQEGLIYESFGGDRELVKTKFLTAMYGKNHWDDPIKRKLRDLYPSVHEMLIGVKKKNYRHAAHLLQNLEATIFVFIIGNRLMNERPDLPVYTIHDSVLTTAPNMSYVESVIADEFRKLGVYPRLKKEE